MKLRNTTQVESTFGEEFASNDFTVAVNGKTFDILLDKLYTNKVRSVVRELWTNAYDAHKAAGVEHEPFFCQLPSPLDPTFTVRDYGISMTPEETFHLYTTVFASSKTEGENANDFVGALGLGSKSPFAYTDAFTVTVWRDGERRQYLCARDARGIPTITHLSTEDSEEPRGVEVSFPVQAHHFQEFRDEARTVARGFDVKPTIPGLELHESAPLFEGENWKLFEQSSNAIRQGCVIYPVHDVHVTSIAAYGNGLVVDVPIGTCDIAANREGLSLDPDTTEKVRTVLEEASADLSRQAQDFIDNSEDLLEANQRYVALSKILRLGRMEFNKQELNGTIELKRKTKSTPEHIFDAKNKPVGRFKVHVNNVRELRFVIDRTNNSVPRKTTRLRRWKDSISYDERQHLFLIKDPTSKQLATLVRRFKLNPDQIIPVASLPDVKIERAPRGKRASTTGVYELDNSGGLYSSPKSLAKDYLYIECPRIDGNHMIFGSFGYMSRISALDWVRLLATKAGITKPIYVMTPSAIKRFKPEEDMKIVNKLEEWINDNLDELLETYKAERAATNIRSNYRIYNDDVIDKLLEDLEIGSVADRTSVSLVQNLVGRLHADLVHEAERESTKLVEDLVERYPLVFGNDDDAKIAYIEALRKEAPALPTTSQT